MRLLTEHPLALTSNDYLHPHGANNDDTHCAGFVRRCEQIFKPPISLLDLGCAGGGLVYDFSLRDHIAFGIDGSDRPRELRRCCWHQLPERVATADITQPFQLLSDDTPETPVLFDLVTAWEVLEHLHDDALSAFFENVRRHLRFSGLFVASVCMLEDVVDEIMYHHTVESKNWWETRLRREGFVTLDGIFKVDQYPRGSGNGHHDWDVRYNPTYGFHITARLAGP